MYVLCKPERVRHLYSRVEHHLYNKTGVRLNMGKTTVFNFAREKLRRVDELQQLGPRAERVWVGDHTLPENEQGLLVLGSPVSTLAYAEKCGKSKLDEELKLLELLP